MRNRDISLKEYVIAQTKATGILPCIKLHKKDDYIAYAQAMYDGGARVIEVTMTTPGVLEAIEAISSHFGDKLLVAAGTVLDPTSAREVIMHGGSIIVNPCVVDDVIDLASKLKKEGKLMPRLWSVVGYNDFGYPQVKGAMEKFKAADVEVTALYDEGRHGFDMWDGYIERFFDWLGLERV